MGTWGSGPFENDGAGDLLAGLREGDFVIDDFTSHVDEEYLEADDAQAAIAYAEIVAVGRGIESASPHLDGIDAAAFCASLTPEQHAWILTTLERAIADSDTSELHELWAENGPEDLEEWRAPVARRLESLRALG
ncbi:DUF4259 domain-containing protein [Prescottella equi]|uniref:DUF4259 domain-containing protein n=1 Tax=Rhodococcus hoagii TaxID=43767 RepID=A0AAE3B9A0_RHOHA|nr:DUF4259 domain-containing protein [Prescottella equi]MBM4492526.1 DUF4259 domain-containing protein [Prescottella equi]MBM4510243.1 DUF4259 domain-containing protein [Prescottella equi]MBM4539510.1 DUF4259 domain-containing protein [Prescottella equi]MBM4669543.1 DUF4259 domain-containing protein [Prescottella equi]MBM4713382.1 DUF4259 domain-containing protein [Prescottella equi]